MRTFYSTIAQVLLCTCFLFSCSSNLSYQQALSKNQRKAKNAEQSKDAKFLVEAKSLNILERELNQVASTNGYASAVVEMAKKNLQDHKSLDAELKSLASKKHYAIPSTMKEEHTMILNELAGMNKQDFDKAFIKDLRKVNEENTFKYENMATEADDADIRAFSARKLGMLRNHAKRLEAVEKDLLHTY